ncbi:5'-nucleotidase C-terminal domain-containing protein [Rhodohalobacter halophilus]|uniref:5'-nucleotidase C-terminal domain-containing protein n=1 Tax=Rhodohalobacter halophilus TaxID=1812810 RepID=UPI00083F9000|nr:5'-nucleotidase [Rhodohalobacter halophilus]
MLIRKIILPLLFIGFISGCSHYSSSEERPDNKAVTATQYPEPDPEISKLLNTYRDSLHLQMGETIATIHDTLRFSKPESALGNLVADALRFRAGSELKQFVNIGVIGDSSFRLYLTPGDLTRMDVLEFMPYENHLVILKLKGERVMELANQVAELGGAPISGMRFRIDGDRARGVLVNAQTLNPAEEYLVATTSWAANGGDQFPALWDYSDRIDLHEVNVRELYIDYFKSRRNIHANRDGRIRS